MSERVSAKLWPASEINARLPEKTPPKYSKMVIVALNKITQPIFLDS